MEYYIRSSIIFLLITILAILGACNGSKRSVNTSLDLPYTDVSNAELQTLLKKKVALVDIRRPEEWQTTGIIPNSKTITFFLKDGTINPAFSRKFKQVVKRDQPVALICRMGNRTRAASRFIAKEMGYLNVYNVKYGIMGWKGEQHAVIPYQKVALR